MNWKEKFTSMKKIKFISMEKAKNISSIVSTIVAILALTLSVNNTIQINKSQKENLQVSINRLYFDELETTTKILEEEKRILVPGNINIAIYNASTSSATIKQIELDYEEYVYSTGAMNIDDIFYSNEENLTVNEDKEDSSEDSKVPITSTKTPKYKKKKTLTLSDKPITMDNTKTSKSFKISTNITEIKVENEIVMENNVHLKAINIQPGTSININLKFDYIFDFKESELFEKTLPLDNYIDYEKLPKALKSNGKIILKLKPNSGNKYSFYLQNEF